MTAELDEQTRREREEIARVMAMPECTARAPRTLRAVTDDGEATSGEWMARVLRLRAMQPPEPPPDPAMLARRRAMERHKSLTDARFTDKELASVLAPAVEPPVVPGHEGSKLAFQAAELFMGDKMIRAMTLLGTSGTGKTAGAGWIAAATGRTFWMQATSYQCPDSEWARIYQRAIHADLLIVNDLGTEPNTEWFTPRLSSVLIHRHDAGRRYVITANMGGVGTPVGKAMDDARRALGMDAGGVALKYIEGRYGAALADRLLDVRLSHVVRCLGDSIRRRRMP